MSDDKEIFELDEAKHIVVKEENQLVFDKIYEFIERVRSSSMANHVLTKNEGVELDSLNLG
jgi:hypothetical protein